MKNEGIFMDIDVVIDYLYDLLKIALGVFIPFFIEYIRKSNKKIKISHFIIDYIRIKGSIDGLTVDVLYDLFGLENNYSLRRRFNKGGLTWWLIYYLLEDYDNCSKEEKIFVLKYIQNNEYKINSWINYSPQTAVNRYLTNSMNITFWCYAAFLLVYYYVLFSEWQWYKITIAYVCVLIVLIIVFMVCDMLVEYLETTFINGWLTKIFEKCYKKCEWFRNFIDRCNK